MSDAGRPGLLRRLNRSGQVLIVPMGEVYPVDFQITPAIGTANLGSCSVAAIISAFGAILAHIPPLPSLTAHEADPHAGDNNVRAMMGRVRELYMEYEGYFPVASTVVVCAILNGQVALPDQMEIMQEAFRDMGLESVTHTYDVPGDRTLPGQGTVTVVSSYLEQGTMGIYVEDNLVTPIPAAAPDVLGEEESRVTQMQQSDYEPGYSEQEYGSAVDVEMRYDESVEQAGPSSYDEFEEMTQGEFVEHAGPSSDAELDAPASRTPTRKWVEVKITIVSHLTRRNEYVFQDAKNRSVSTKD
ncbi:hypothetical protein CONLIGDRAFT_635343 [Coniochaeta ligniaria NRRL 30616]|uniref:Uncharacterized protein n=1 Tax=Coniochaeta ligniaria NRRL 30616 TaxID=1408157 RepID=A0A1J7IWQ1_9PEZI|nr:hypothetical protein CONLIGDRAFT_635343 [Coniochaeta ligniaria NRRL 30616]